MTEELARNKWCPMTRFNGGLHQSTFNRGDRDPLNNPDKSNLCVPNCIASDCMMWRTIFTEGYVGLDEEGDEVKILGNYNSGYCGLAGKP